MAVYDHIDGPRSSVFIFADHASNYVPDWVGDLGVSEADMSRHIALDIGTETVARELCEELECSGLICGFSRLVIDVHRDPNADDLIPEVSDGTHIPGNQNLNKVKRAERTERLYDSYHAALGDDLDARPDCLAISIHSFTPQMQDQTPRSTDIGLLVKHDSETAVAFIAALSDLVPEFQIDVNEPYSAFDYNYTVDHNVVPKDLRHLVIEIRQDHIGTYDDAKRMAHILARAIETLLPETPLLETPDARHDL